MKLITKPVATLTGPAIDWVVGKTQGMTDLEFSYSEDENGKKWYWVFHGAKDLPGYVDYRPRHDWKLVGGLMDTHNINIDRNPWGGIGHGPDRELFIAQLGAPVQHPTRFGTWHATAFGDDRRVAVLRCYIQKFHSEWVEVPEELT